MSAARRNSEAGFTLLELMTVVGMIGGLAAIAVPMFMGSVDETKAVDVKAEMMKMAMAAKVAYLNDGTFPQGTAQVLPAADGANCHYKNRMIPVSGAWRDDAIWGNLDVMVSQPTQFSYHYTSSEPGLATISATADLNCDGILTTYTLTVVDGVYDVAALQHPTNSVAMADDLDSGDDLEPPTMSLPPTMGLPEGTSAGNDRSQSGLGDGTNPGQGAGRDNASNTGTDNPSASHHD